ncbi:MAG: CHAT domain-containing protein [Myxococcota bacterium]
MAYLASLPSPAHAQSVTESGVSPPTAIQATPASGLRPQAEELRARARKHATTGDAETEDGDQAVRVDPESEIEDAIAELLAEILDQPASPSSPALIVHLHHSREIARDGLEAAPLTGRDAAFAAGLDRAARAAERLGDPALAAHALMEGALLAERTQDDATALLRARGAAERAAANGLRRPLYRAQWLIARIHERAGDRPAALRAYRAAVQILEDMKADLVAGTQQDAFSFREEVAPVYLGLADLLLRRAESESGADEANQALLREARETLEASRQAELRDHFQDACLTQLEAESPDAVPGTVVVYPVVLPNRLVLIVSRDGRLTQHRAPIEGEEYAELTETFRMHLENRMTRRYRRPAAALYEALILPIAPRLAEAPVETLVFIPDRFLRQVPLGALYDRETKRFLIEDYAVAVAPSLELTSPRRLPKEGTSLLAGALTKSVQGYPALEFVAEEVKAASQLFSSEVLMDEALQVEPLTNSLREMPFDILHIASHAEFRGEANQSFILTWDDKLSLEALAAAIGRARFRTERPLELLVLSACETAVGDDRAALGLAGAALQMGARSVLASLWSVNDEASSALMARYYGALSEPGTTRAEALRKAQRSLIAEKAYAHPSAWAPFILIGSWL